MLAFVAVLPDLCLVASSLSFPYCVDRGAMEMVSVSSSHPPAGSARRLSSSPSCAERVGDAGARRGKHGATVD